MSRVVCRWGVLYNVVAVVDYETMNLYLKQGGNDRGFYQAKNSCYDGEVE